MALPARQPKRHVYLPGLSAFDKGHRGAALSEMGYRGGAGEYDAGSVFVDTVEAQAHVQQRYQLRHTEVLDTLLRGGLAPQRKRKLQREYRALKSAHANVHVVDPLAAGFDNHEAGDADILFVKGHGSAGKPHRIATRTAPVDERHTEQPGVFEHATRVRVQRGFRVEHTDTEIGDAIHRISRSVDSPGLDVRISSCGSGGTASRDVGDYVAPAQGDTFAGNVSSRLDALHTDARVRVSGYHGDSNTTLPSTGMDGDGFVTKIKQRDANLIDPAPFQRAIAHQTTRRGDAVTMGTERIKKPLTDLALGTQFKAAHLAPAPDSFGASVALRDRMQPFTKIVTTTAQETRQVGKVPRRAVRTQFPRI